MKTYILLLMLAISLNFSCKTQEKVKNEKPVDVVVHKGTTLGVVSHQYRKTGCATVVIVNKEGKDITLIPFKALPVEYDKDGLEIYFNYRPLKVKNPDGCMVGIPIMLSDISGK